MKSVLKLLVGVRLSGDELVPLLFHLQVVGLVSLFQVDLVYVVERGVLDLRGDDLVWLDVDSHAVYAEPVEHLRFLQILF